MLPCGSRSLPGTGGTRLPWTRRDGQQVPPPPPRGRAVMSCRTVTVGVPTGPATPRPPCEPWEAEPHPCISCPSPSQAGTFIPNTHSEKPPAQGECGGQARGPCPPGSAPISQGPRLSDFCSNSATPTAALSPRHLSPGDMVAGRAPQSPAASPHVPGHTHPCHPSRPQTQAGRMPLPRPLPSGGLPMECGEGPAWAPSQSPTPAPRSELQAPPFPASVRGRE